MGPFPGIIMLCLYALGGSHLVSCSSIGVLINKQETCFQVIVSRMRYISSQTERAIRFVGLSTALANAWYVLC